MNDPAECTVPVLLTIVLLCSGKGADTQSYRPNLDESQWWGRRDALVRCVAASLFGPRGGIRNDRSAPDAPSIDTELVLLFDEDGCQDDDDESDSHPISNLGVVLEGVNDGIAHSPAQSQIS